MLNRELVVLLKWLNDRSTPVSKATMEQLKAPGYSDSRIEAMRADGYIDRSVNVENNAVTGIYAISDKGRAELQSATSISRENSLDGSEMESQLQ